MKTFRFLIFPVVFLFSISTSGQGWDAVFPSDSMIGITGFSVGFDVDPTQDGGYLLAGEVDYPTGAIRHFIRLIKTDDQGNEEWSHTYKAMSVAYERLVFVEELANGEIILGGAQSDIPYLMKTDSEGEPIWEKTYESDTTNHVRSGLITPSGDIILAGYASNWLQYPVLIKTNLDGELIWKKYITASDQFLLSSFNYTSLMY